MHVCKTTIQDYKKKSKILSFFFTLMAFLNDKFTEDSINQSPNLESTEVDKNCEESRNSSLSLESEGGEQSELAGMDEKRKTSSSLSETVNWQPISLLLSYSGNINESRPNSKEPAATCWKHQLTALNVLFTVEAINPSDMIKSPESAQSKTGTKTPTSKTASKLKGCCVIL
jgi:hypothetical protein